MRPNVPSESDIAERARHFATRSLWLAYCCGLLLSITTSAGVVAERLLGGNVEAALSVDVAVLGVAILAMTLTSRPLATFFGDTEDANWLVRLRSGAVLLPQLLGVLSGIALVHLSLRYSGFSALQWMSERPAQFINDAVAALGTLAAVWACASRPLRMCLLLEMLGLLLLYRATGQHWHVDHAPRVFRASIQELVAAQVIAAATGLLAFRKFSSQ
jgi:hypothetical protein